MRKTPFIALFTIFLVAGSWGQVSQEPEPSSEEKILGLTDIINYALENNPDLEDAAYEVKIARDNLTGLFTLNNTKVTGEGVWSSIEDATETQLSGSLKMSMPVTNQISISGSWDMDDSGSAGVTIKPLNLTTTAESSRTTLKKAEVLLTYLTASISCDTALTVLNYLTAKADYELQIEKALLAEKQYDAGYALYLEDEITYEDLQDLSDALTTAQRQEIENQITLADSKSDLILLLGPEADFLPAEISNEMLEGMIALQKTAITAAEKNSVSSQSLETAEADYALSRAELSKTLAFQPDLSISASASLSAGNTPTFQTGVSLSLSPDTFDSSEKDQLTEKTNQYRRDLLLEQFKLTIQAEAALDSITAAEKEIALAKSGIERQQVIFKETLLLMDQGERTRLETEDARLTLADAELALTSALISSYKARAEYLALYP